MTEQNKDNKRGSEEKGLEKKEDVKMPAGDKEGTGLGHTIGSAVNSGTGTSGVTGEKSFQEHPDNIKQPEKTENDKKSKDKTNDDKTIKQGHRPL